MTIEKDPHEVEAEAPDEQDVVDALEVECIDNTDALEDADLGGSADSLESSEVLVGPVTTSTGSPGRNWTGSLG